MFLKFFNSHSSSLKDIPVETVDSSSLVPRRLRAFARVNKIKKLVNRLFHHNDCNPTVDGSHLTSIDKSKSGFNPSVGSAIIPDVPYPNFIFLPTFVSHCTPTPKRNLADSAASIPAPLNVRPTDVTTAKVPDSAHPASSTTPKHVNIAEAFPAGVTATIFASSADSAFAVDVHVTSSNIALTLDGSAHSASSATSDLLDARTPSHLDNTTNFAGLADSASSPILGDVDTAGAYSAPSTITDEAKSAPVVMSAGTIGTVEAALEFVDGVEASTTGIYDGTSGDMQSDDRESLLAPEEHPAKTARAADTMSSDSSTLTEGSSFGSSISRPSTPPSSLEDLLAAADRSFDASKEKRTNEEMYASFDKGMFEQDYPYAEKRSRPRQRPSKKPAQDGAAGGTNADSNTSHSNALEEKSQQDMFEADRKDTVNVAAQKKKRHGKRGSRKPAQGRAAGGSGQATEAKSDWGHGP